MKILVTNTKGGTGKSTLVASLTEVLKADIVDYDPQGTIKVNAELTGRFIPIKEEEGKKKHLIYDTPPYNNPKLNSLIKEVDYVLIPCKLMYAELVGVATIYDKIKRLGGLQKSRFVFNDVKPQNKKLNLAVQKMYKNNYKDIKIANTQIPSWIGFSRVLAEPLPERERKKIQELINELK